jgi:hypothetical protein
LFVAGTHTGGRAVVCGVMYREFRLLDSILAGDERGVLLTEYEDPSTVFGLCCGDDLGELPIGSREQEEARVADGAPGRAHYTNCPMWQLEKGRIEAGAEAIFPKPTTRPHAADTLGLDRPVVGVDALDGPQVLTQRQEAGTMDALDWLVDGEG